VSGCQPVRRNRQIGQDSPVPGAAGPRAARAPLAGLAVLAALGVLGGAGCEAPPPTVFDGPLPPRLVPVATYDGSGQAVHPDVVRVDAVPGGPFWLALTPYPQSDEKLENPCVYRSRDGLAWAEPAPGVNPVVPRPLFDHNSDPDLTWRDGEFRLLYLETQRREYRPDSASFHLLRWVRSADGVGWSEPETALRWDLDRDPLYLSPTLVQAPGGDRVYLVDGPGRRIVWFPWPVPAGDPAGRPEPGGTLETGLSGVRPWHLDVFPAPGGWVALLCARGPDATNNADVDLWLGASPDLERWAFRPEPLLTAGPALLDTEAVYRSTGLVAQGRLCVWFSARTVPGRWIIGATSFPDDAVRELLAAAGAAGMAQTPH